ncbi:MAG: class I SAM-dependent RNA methyltransferase [Elusimicrobia bacterium]|nr:class I SAM-dependent RNA methyltransferase [Elusimicrobiota bacterium]
MPERTDRPTTLPPGCEPACPGCRHRTLAASESLAQKAAHLERTLSAWADRLAPVLPAPARLGYRERVSLNASWQASLCWRFGLVRHRDRKDEFIAVPDCPVHAPAVNRALAELGRVLPPPPGFPLAFVAVSGRQLTLIVKARTSETPWAKALAPKLKDLGFEGLWLHCHPAAGRRLFGRSGWTLVWGEPRSRDRHGSLYGPTAFSQAQPELHADALSAMHRHLGPGPGTLFVDLYCGTGKSLAAAAASGAAAVGVELSGEAVACAQENAPGALLLRGACSLRRPQLDSFIAERPGLRLLLAMNPPRSGLEPQVRSWVARLAPERAAYLSCSAGTLARDLGELEAAGLRVERILSYDFFPLTHHVEALALLSRAA